MKELVREARLSPVISVRADRKTCPRQHSMRNAREKAVQMDQEDREWNCEKVPNSSGKKDRINHHFRVSTSFRLLPP
jgi:hypothetical protein